MPRWLPSVLARIHELAASGHIRLTLKAAREVSALGLGLDPEDVRDILAGLRPSESVGRLASRVTGEWMYVFRPCVGGETVYVKLILRSDCVVVSFHEERDHHGKHE
jgi:hypothetical protein